MQLFAALLLLKLDDHTDFAVYILARVVREIVVQALLRMEQVEHLLEEHLLDLVRF